MPGKPKGLPKTGGRAKGSQNKFTRTVKDTFSEVFNDLQDDPHSNLFSWGRENPTEFYKLASKLIPTEITAQVATTQIIWNEEKTYEAKQEADHST